MILHSAEMALDIARKKFSSQDTRIFLTGKGSDTVYNFQIKGNTSSTYAFYCQNKMGTNNERPLRQLLV